MDLTTKYMGLELKNPLVASASPLSMKIENYKKMEDAGISAIVNGSLFEEQINQEMFDLDRYTTQGTESFAESLSYYPKVEIYDFGPDQYLKHIAAAKKAVSIPVIASLNGFSKGGWTKYAKKMEEAGADALELNIYQLSTDPQMEGSSVENEYLDIFTSVRSEIDIPIAIKMHPFFSSTANMAKKLDEAGADALVLFNRFYQPDIDLEELEIRSNIMLSTPQSLRLPLRWIAILYGNVKANLAATRGIYSAEDVIKMLMVGSDVTMLCSTLLKNGIDHTQVLLKDLEGWMKDHEYESVSQMKGSMSQKSCPDPKAFERAQYISTIKSW